MSQICGIHVISSWPQMCGTYFLYEMPGLRRCVTPLRLINDDDDAHAKNIKRHRYATTVRLINDGAGA